MRMYGFSTGAIALGDFRLALDLLKRLPLKAVELSALRLPELRPLLEFSENYDWSRFSYISVHAPSVFSDNEEAEVVNDLSRFVDRGWPVIVHPDTIHSFELWEELGESVFIENMDRRKPAGRTAEELSAIFQKLPLASMCFDIAHARQFDTSMTEAYKILRNHSNRMRQVHFSEVSTSSKHDVVSHSAVQAYSALASLVPQHIPVILEMPIIDAMFEEQLLLAMRVFEPGGHPIQREISNVLGNRKQT